MNTKNILIYSGLIIGGLLLGYLFFGGTSEPQTLDEHISETHTDEAGNIVYTCSMHPQVRESEPGNCPICGMELIPADQAEDDDGSSQNPNAVKISQAAMALANIQTTAVREEIPEHTVQLPGKVAVNQNLVSNITAHFPGRVRELYVDYTGDYVRKGQKLASIYSPELITAQRELLETARFKEQNPRLYEAARRKLSLWEFPEETIRQIEQSGEVMEELDFFSPVSGYVSEIRISREDHISEGTVLYRVADLSKVWVEFEAYESEVSQLSKGDEVDFTVSSLPGEQFSGTIDFIEPFLNDASRTVNVRVTAQNPDTQMKPGMFAEGEVISQSNQNQQLLVPRSAVLWTGERSVVFVDVSQNGNPAFEAREVVLGSRAGNDYVIKSGLEAGEQVVTNGTFKIDAAAQLSDKLSMMNRNPGSGANRGAHDHSNMDMGDSSENAEDHSGHQMEQMEEEMEGSNNPEVMDMRLEEMVPEYMKLREALTEDDFDAAQRHIKMFSRDNFGDIEELRAEFKMISERLINRIESEGYEGELYKQYCPMYDGGSNWVSDSEEIKNPFYGSQMHNCGETVEKLNTEQGTSN
ncbi:efflux RND transporter periplasmic adaptor subunit [Gracilimonas mengyeensis]|uniref:Membrane fusion protein, Cu(I)/Ag(I) efflux system n=1 Tax=Gracilimonas mengyeensis TaxID=1302730 RepID=A0A521CXB3_9BACT|nr:efflux RND transporter periplasmic adaptor subunit [Gracilimonas mengyeensis]SMO64042.1 membrane fusion protein, Cu(I)/Ag(I) efflux system [Gracilimonas mengyeensis]